MKIIRFDGTEFRAIQCGNSGGYYLEGSDEAKRAILLMKEKVYKYNPKKNWHINGWKFTKYGKTYYEEFMKQVREKHGHVWMTHKETNPDLYDTDDEYSNSIDIFALSSGYHNGPKCKNCGYEFCWHCTLEIDVPVCSNRKG